jgi:hypothetical protein
MEKKKKPSRLGFDTKHVVKTCGERQNLEKKKPL